MKKLNFKVSSSLKNLIGKELITNEFVAVFELIKNSYDASASEVDVKFLNTLHPEMASLVIVDNGWGMNFSDIQNKWLFVGYSAKRDGTEHEDYRHRFREKRVFAGAKGVGRFSCDRLGSRLTLITKKRGYPVEKLLVSWDDFERSQQEEFIKIPVQSISISEEEWNKYSSSPSGTILIIENLRDIWDRQRIFSLRKSLEKLINPLQADGDDSGFRIHISVPDELQTDEQPHCARKVNGYIQNFLFEKIQLKTTSIHVKIDEQGKYLSTDLYDRGQRIYSIQEINRFSNLQNIRITLFQLNREAKTSFTKTMGIEAKNFGSVFIYKNGFRVLPYGEPGDDSLKIDTRKQQGYNRYLGTRDLVGRIEITGASPQLTESTSRDGGFIKTDTYSQLLECFTKIALRRLEAYAIDVIKWGDPFEDGKALQPEDVKEQIVAIIKKMTDTKKGFVNLEYCPDFLVQYQKAQSQSVYGVAQSLLNTSRVTGNTHLTKAKVKHTKQVKDLIVAKQEAERDSQLTREKNRNLSLQLENKAKQVLFLQSIENLDLDRVVGYVHDIGVHASKVKSEIELLAFRKSRGGISQNDISKFMELVTISIDKIVTMSHFITKANFNALGTQITTDVVQYIKQYLEVIIADMYSSLKVHCNDADCSFMKTFRPLEMSLLFDNFASNALRASATLLSVSFKLVGESLQIVITDNGSGWHSEYSDLQDVFQKGMSTTAGSGLGLYNAKKYVEEELGGEIQAEKGGNNEFMIKITLGKRS